jgi:hypothetical protein
MAELLVSSKHMSIDVTAFQVRQQRTASLGLMVGWLGCSSLHRIEPSILAADLVKAT